MDQERQSRIRLSAYHLWVEADRPSGRHLDFWLTAERDDAARILDADLEEGLEETFPASDPPSLLRREGSV